jgi:thioredoxin reductase (NADPH)
MENKNIYDVIVIGSGPAGYTAGLYTSRAYLKTLIITGIEQGGQLTTTTEVENFPGFPKGILGPQLMMEMKVQAEKFCAIIKNETVSSVKYQVSRENNKTLFQVQTESQIYQTKSVIIATGASAQYLGIPSEEKLKGKGVSACATCDGFFFKGKEVVVLGGGDTAMEEANFLTTFATKVTVVHRRDEFRASSIMLDRAKKNPKISFLLNKTVEEITGEQNVTGIKLKDSKTGKVEVYPTQGVFLAIGHKPNTGFLEGFVEMDEKGYVLTNFQFSNSKIQTSSNHQLSKIQTATNVPGVFAAGDCVDFRYRQAIVAAGMGCMAALDAQKWLEEIK